MRTLRGVVFVLASLVVVPSAVYAQASIAGIVKDTSGAVLPGVTVEASSPALIEKSRSVVTDGTGQYKIVDLRPGTYAVTFTLSGFSVIKREGIELTGSFTASVNAELRVGAVQETVTVTGETPIVDVQSTTRQRVIDHDVIDAIPTGRLPTQLAVLIPGVSNAGNIGFNGMTAQDVGGAGGDQNVSLTAHGGRGSDQRITQNGLALAGSFRPDTDMTYSPNLGATQEVSIDISGVSAEAAEGGVRINLIPKEGGNTFRGITFASFANESMASSNFTDDLKARGFTTPNAIKKVAEVNPGFGGPILKDKLWFFTSGRVQVADNYVGGMFFDPNWNVPNYFATSAGRVALDQSHRVSNDALWKVGEGRLTWQANGKNKFGIAFTKENQCKCPSFISATRSPGINNRWGIPHHFETADWSSPVTNRILLEAGVFHQTNHWGWFPLDGTNPDMIAWTEQSTGIIYKVFGTYADHWVHDLRYRAALSYITGAHALKVGLSNGRGDNDILLYQGGANHQLQYRFNNGVPNQLTILATPYHDLWQLDNELGMFAQDRWTVKHVTLTGGIRADYLKSHYPGQTLGPVQFVPNRNITIPDTPGLSWKDVTPRMGASYDVFGTGKTALKVTLNKYLAGDRGGSATAGTIADPVANLVNNTTRNWTDANGNFVPDCDLTNPLANGECQAMANRNFGTNVPSTAFDPKALGGWGVRTYNWEFSTGVQHEILPRVSVDFGYFRRWYGNFLATDSLAYAPSDFNTFSITAPSDSRLPGSGGYAIGGLYNLNPAKFGVPANNLVTFASNYGKQIEHWNGIDVSINARLQRGLLVQGGFSTGRTSTDSCEIVAQLPELIAGVGVVAAIPGAAATSATPQQYCHVDTPFLTQIKGLGSYTIPKIDVQVSGSFQSVPGPQVVGNYNAPNAVVVPSLGRSLSGGAANVTVNLVTPGAMYGERMNQLDLRFGKILKFSRTRSVLSLDLYNALNANTVLTESNAFAIFRQPQVILLARFAKISLQFDF